MILPKQYSGATEQFNVYSAMEELIRKRKFSNHVWNKLYKKDLLEGVEFPLNITNEDQVFTYKAFSMMKKFVSIDIPKYYHLHHRGSATGTHTYVKTMDFYKNSLDRIEDISRNFPSLINLAQKELFFYFLQKYKELKDNPGLDNDRKKRDLLKNYILDNYGFLILNPLFSRKHKIVLRLFRINFEFGCNVYYFNKGLKKRGNKLSDL